MLSSVGAIACRLRRLAEARLLSDRSTFYHAFHRTDLRRSAGAVEVPGVSIRPPGRAATCIASSAFVVPAGLRPHAGVYLPSWQSWSRRTRFREVSTSPSNCSVRHAQTVIQRVFWNSPPSSYLPFAICWDSCSPLRPRAWSYSRPTGNSARALRDVIARFRSALSGSTTPAANFISTRFIRFDRIPDQDREVFGRPGASGHELVDCCAPR